MKELREIMDRVFDRQPVPPTQPATFDDMVADIKNSLAGSRSQVANKHLLRGSAPNLSDYNGPSFKEGGAEEATRSLEGQADHLRSEARHQEIMDELRHRD